MGENRAPGTPILIVESSKRVSEYSRRPRRRLAGLAGATLVVAAGVVGGSVFLGQEPGLSGQVPVVAQERTLAVEGTSANVEIPADLADDFIGLPGGVLSAQSTPSPASVDEVGEAAAEPSPATVAEDTFAPENASLTGEPNSTAEQQSAPSAEPAPLEPVSPPSTVQEDPNAMANQISDPNGRLNALVDRFGAASESEKASLKKQIRAEYVANIADVTPETAAKIASIIGS